MSRSEKQLLFRRAGGKYPSARRERRAISVGLLSLLLGKRTQESWCQGASESVVERATEEEARRLVSVDRESVRARVGEPFGKGGMGVGVGTSSAWKASFSGLRRSKASAPGTGLPLMPHASTGRTSVCRLCTVSLGHMRFAFRRTLAEQLYLIVMPASVSSLLTWCK